MRGLGELINGVWGRVPQWVWAKPKVLVGNADSPAGHTTYEYKSSVLDLYKNRLISLLSASPKKGGYTEMSYSILRVAKVKQAANTTGIQKHVQRENNNYNNKDIDHERTHLNVDLIHGREKQNFNELIEKRIEEGYTGKRKIRSDAIRHIDGIITSDNAFFESMDQDQVKKYFRDSLEFLKDEYGKENVVYATIHMDENTPHMHFGVVPLTEDGRLSAKDVIGNKSALTKLQDRFNEFINDKGYQLERGEPKEVTKKKHQDMDRFKQETKYHEKVFLEVQQKVEKQEQRLGELTATLEPKAVKFKSKEVKTEVKDKLFGKSEVIKKKTGNLVLTPTQYKKMNEQITAAVAIQKDYNRLKNTDLAKENQQLRKDLKRENERYDDLTVEYTNLYLENERLSKENSLLKSHISVLEKNLRVLYKNTKKLFKDKFKGFRDVLKGDMDKQGVENYFERVHVQEQRKMREKNNSLER